MKKAFIFLILAMGVSGIVFAQSGDDNIQARVALETSLESRLKNVISEIIGSDKLIVIVNVQLRTEKEEKTLKNVVQQKREESTIILPGVPAKDSYTKEKETFPMLAPLTFSETKTSIKKINSIILVDKSIEESTMPIIQQVASGLLGIDSARGDKLEVKQISFKGDVFDWKSLLLPPKLFYAVALIVLILIFLSGVVFAFGPLRGFFGRLIDSLKIKAEKGDEGDVEFRRDSVASRAAAGSFGGGSAPSGGGGLGWGGGGASGPKPFSFINESHLGDLTYLMKTAPPEAIAILINYINPVLGSKLMSSLDDETQKKVVETLSKIQEFSKENIKEIEDKLKSKLDYMVGGEERLTALVGYFDRETQEKVLGSVRTINPSMADKIKKTIFVFENIVKLDQKIVQMIIRNINPQVFAQVLKSMNAEFQRKIFGMLPEGQVERLQQEMQLSKPLSKKRIEDEKRVIVNLVKSFEQQGLIELNR